MVLEYIGQCLIAIYRKVVTDIFGIDGAAASKNDTRLAIIERNIVLRFSPTAVRFFVQ